MQRTEIRQRFEQHDETKRLMNAIEGTGSFPRAPLPTDVPERYWKTAPQLQTLRPKRVPEPNTSCSGMFSEGKHFTDGGERSIDGFLSLLLRLLRVNLRLLRVNGYLRTGGDRFLHVVVGAHRVAPSRYARRES
jgi:hypothetical protein